MLSLFGVEYDVHVFPWYGLTFLISFLFNFLIPDKRASKFSTEGSEDRSSLASRLLRVLFEKYIHDLAETKSPQPGTANYRISAKEGSPRALQALGYS